MTHHRVGVTTIDQKFMVDAKGERNMVLRKLEEHHSSQKDRRDVDLQRSRFKITKIVHERYRASDWETSLAPFICAK